MEKNRPLWALFLIKKIGFFVQKLGRLKKDISNCWLESRLFLWGECTKKCEGGYSTNFLRTSYHHFYRACKVTGVKVYPRQTWNFRAHAVSACISLWHHGAMHAVQTCISLSGACIGLSHHRPMHALTAWNLKFQVCLGYTFTPGTLISNLLDP